MTMTTMERIKKWLGIGTGPESVLRRRVHRDRMLCGLFGAILLMPVLMIVGAAILAGPEILFSIAGLVGALYVFGVLIERYYP